MKRKTARIPYGPEGHETSMWWTVKVRSARKNVTINGTVADALRAYPGVTVGCALSRMAINNSKVFDHPVYLAHATKSGLLLVDSLNKDGSPKSAVKYGHRYSAIVDRNDDGSLKRLVKDQPQIIERQFTVGPPRKSGLASAAARERASATRKSRKRTNQHRGALARAVKAGRIGAHVAEQLAEMMHRNPSTSADHPQTDNQATT